MNRGRRAVLLSSVALVTCLVIAWWALRPNESPVSPPPPAAAAWTPVEPASPAPASVEPTSDDPLAAFATLRGRVIDAATREPVREFELRFAEWGRSANDRDVPTKQKFRSDDGTFEWPRIPPGQWGLIAEAPGYQRFLTDLKFVRGEATQEVIVPLVRGAVLRGRVVDATSGVGIASAYIGSRTAGQGLYEGNFRMRPATQSRVGGAFVLNGIPPGRIVLSVGANNYASRELDLVVDENTAPVEIALSTGGLIAGRLAGPDGATPVEGAASISRIDGNSGGYSANTNEAGEFSFSSLEAGTYRVTGRGPGGSITRDFALAEGERIEGVILVLRGGRTIRGTISGLRPAELRNLSIHIHRDGEIAAPSTPATINDRGEYEVRDVQPGRVRVAADVSMRRQLARTVDVPANSDITVDFDFPRGARVSGRVTQRGRPITGVWVEPRPTTEGKLFNYGAATSSTGDYVIEDLPHGEYTIWIQGFKSRPFQVAGDTVFDIDASPQLAGRILEDNGKAPITEAELDLWPADLRSSRIRANDRSDHYGRFAMAGLEPGEFILTIYKPGYDLYRERIAYASPMTDMTIRLSRGNGVQLRARDSASGKPLRKLSAFEMIGDRNGLRLSVALDEDGVGYLPGGLQGATIAMWADGYEQQTVSAWDGQRLDLKFARATR
jgi:hypothetical protein